ncbi:MAG: methyltransferase domain-containing protein [Candidatus Theseobacter exili]|nr:methyltransferase domain-containing protein [Candidatus Theseobacter exili]
MKKRFSKKQNINNIIGNFANDNLQTWENDYFEEHWKRYIDTIKLIPKPKDSNSKLLDVGIFPGHLSAIASVMGYEIHGISNEEITPEFHSHIQQASFQIQQMDIESEPFPYDSNYFDAVLFCEVIEHLYRDPFIVLLEIFRVLKPGGILILSTPNLASWENIYELLHERSYMTPVDSSLNELFPENPNLKHVREYTMKELSHILCSQKTYPYIFIPVSKSYSWCWDNTAADCLKDFLHPKLFIKQCLSWLKKAIYPQYRSSLILCLQKPEKTVFIPSDRWTDISGFHKLEQTHPNVTTFRRNPIKSFRWTTNKASFTFNTPAFCSKSTIMLTCCYPVPVSVQKVTVEFIINGISALTETINPSTTLKTFSISVPDTAIKSELIHMTINSTTWCPKAAGIDDSRDLGIMIAWDGLLTIY